ncbi:MAG: TonB-dependent receptor [Bacteroidota bacterium]
MKKILLSSFLLMVCLCTAALAQERTVSGKVTSIKDGSTLPGVNVILKGTTNGTVTDIDGNYKLSVPADASVLVFSFIGLVTEEVEIGTRSVIDLQMSEDVTQLSEVVVTGYSELTQKQLTGSAFNVGAEKLEQVPIASFDQILQGRAPGLFITQTSGQPGAAARVRIRGESSINSDNDPLYMVDGVSVDPGVFATLNPNDFETVSVLKDAAATAIYGSRGSNGVIVITTKRGKAGSTRLNYRFQYGWSDRTRTTFDVLNTEQKVARELATGQGLAPTLTSEQRDSLIARGTTDWTEELFRTGITQSHELNASGGTEDFTYYISANYFGQEGITPDSELNRYTLRFNFDSNPKDKFRWGTSNSLGYSRERRQRNTGLSTFNPFLAAFLLNPYDAVRDPDTGEFLAPAAGINIVALNEETERLREEKKLLTNLYLEYDIIEGLTARTSWGMDLREREFTDIDIPFAFSALGPNNQGSIDRDFNRRIRFIGTNSISYGRQFGEDHNFKVGLFHEINYEEFRNTASEGFGLNRILEPNGTTPGTDANGFIPSFTGARRDNALLSYFANVAYDYKDKYFLNVTVRRDGSSRFGANNRFANFWSVGTSWQLSDEDFISNVSWIDNLKLKLSYGTTGNQFVGQEDFFPSLPRFAEVTFDGNTGIVPSNIEQTDLRWETTSTLNLGIDFALFTSRISGTIDLYRALTSDLFITQQLSRTTGFTSLDVNAGELVNQGVELSLNGDIIRTNDFTLSANVIFTYNDNEVTDLGQVDEFEQGTSIIREGLPLGSHFVVGYAGVNPANGAPLYTDADGNVTETFDPGNARADFGTFQAPYFGSFGLNASYKGLEFGAFFTYAWDYVLFNNNQFFFENPNFAGFNQHVNVLRTWEQPGDITDIHSIAFPTQLNSSRFLEDASFLRLRNVTIAYNLPTNLIGKHLNNVRVYVQGQNLLTWTDWQGFDPENGNNILQGDFPAIRQFLVGLDIGF